MCIVSILSYRISSSCPLFHKKEKHVFDFCSAKCMRLDFYIKFLFSLVDEINLFIISIHEPPENMRNAVAERGDAGSRGARSLIGSQDSGSLR